MDSFNPWLVGTGLKIHWFEAFPTTYILCMTPKRLTWKKLPANYGAPGSHNSLNTKGGIISESTGNLQISRRNIPKQYPKLLHPEYDNDKMSILYFFDFKGLIYLWVVQMSF